MKYVILFLCLPCFICCGKFEVPTLTCPFGQSLNANTSGNPSILVIGDSISIGYTPTLRSTLANYDVQHNPCNAMTSTWTLSQIDYWLDSRDSFYAITWNNGLWDIADWVNTPAADYVANLHAIAKKIKAKTTRPLFITTTQVLPNTANRNDANVIAFNQLAVQVMTEENIPVLDLYTFSTTIQNLHSTPTDVHYCAYGYQLLGEQVLNELNMIYGIN